MKKHVALIIALLVTVSAPTQAYNTKEYVGYGTALTLAAAGTATLLSNQLGKPKSNEVRKPSVFSAANRKRLIIAVSLYLAALAAGTYGLHQRNSNIPNTSGKPALADANNPNGPSRPNEPSGPSDSDGPNGPPDDFFNFDDFLGGSQNRIDSNGKEYAEIAAMKKGRSALYSLVKDSPDRLRLVQEMGNARKRIQELRADIAAKQQSDPSFNPGDSYKEIALLHQKIFDKTQKLSRLTEQETSDQEKQPRVRLALQLLDPINKMEALLVAHKELIVANMSNNQEDRNASKQNIKAIYDANKNNPVFMRLLAGAEIKNDIERITAQ